MNHPAGIIKYTNVKHKLGNIRAPYLFRMLFWKVSGNGKFGVSRDWNMRWSARMMLEMVMNRTTRIYDTNI